MQIGMIGLGRMGGNMVRRLLRAGHECVVWNQSPGPIAELAKAGRRRRQLGRGSRRRGSRRRAPCGSWCRCRPWKPWCSRSAGCSVAVIASSTAATRRSSTPSAAPASSALAASTTWTSGTSGGVWGLERGYCLMIGGPQPAVSRLTPVFRDLAPGRGSVVADRQSSGGEQRQRGLPALRSGRCGPLRKDGPQRHRVRDHGGLRGGLQSIPPRGRRPCGRGARPTMPSATSTTSTCLPSPSSGAAAAWCRPGCWTSPPRRSPATRSSTAFQGKVSDSGEGRWTLKAAIDTAVPVPVLSAALYSRFESRGEGDFANRLLSAMRLQFGGHREPPK